MKAWQVSILTLFPEMFPGPLKYSIAGKALENNFYSLNMVNIRDFALDKFKTVDDKIFGGGAGMLMKPDVVSNAIESVTIKNKVDQLLYFSPRGQKFDQQEAKKLILNEHVLMLCGRYEGVDQRIFKKYEFKEYSLGDFILSGGEVAALTILDSCIRILPGVIENDEANLEESFSLGEDGNLLEYDQYTRPFSWEGMEVPQVLLSGNHKEIAKWRKENALKNTLLRRPDLLREKK